MSLSGIRVVLQPLAERVCRRARIERTAIKKRRKGWTLRYEEKREPCVYQIGEVLHVHPAIYEHLKRLTK